MTRKHLQSMREREMQARAHTQGRDTHIIYIHIQKHRHTHRERYTHIDMHVLSQPIRSCPSWRGDTLPPFPPSEVSALTLMSIIQPIRHLFFWGTQVCRRRHLISSRAHLAPPGALPTVIFLEHSSEDFHSVWP